MTGALLRASRERTYRRDGLLSRVARRWPRSSSCPTYADEKKGRGDSCARVVLGARGGEGRRHLPPAGDLSLACSTWRTTTEAPNQERLIYGAIQGCSTRWTWHTVFCARRSPRDEKIDTSGEWGGSASKSRARTTASSSWRPSTTHAPAARAGLKAGDELVGIDGESTRGMDVGRAMQKRFRGRTRAPEHPAQGQRAARMPSSRDRYPASSPCGGRASHSGHRPREGEELPGAHGPVPAQGAGPGCEAPPSGKELRGLVLTAQQPWGSLIAAAMSDRFLPATCPSSSRVAGTGHNSTEERSKDRDTEKNYPVAVLVNGGSAPRRKSWRARLPDHGWATPMGSPYLRQGAGSSVQTVNSWSDGSGLKLTIARYYTPKRRSIQERGITRLLRRTGRARGQPGREAPVRRTSSASFPRRVLRHQRACTSRRRRGPPENLPKWETTAGLKDYPLKVALE